ncbi:nitrate ABC transporter, nitrate-binding protein [Pseudanabaena sp. lw0831]|uniref:CmpA/NrtA family ABC transporter substrate-binding protein n=1 Tax=Pseudanabaena sp. lw0831 TaxID=1357935 RepID=UPI0019161B3A|nr:CmpA/NrtA family ABC transporter substrate-binding protein [Pseudanabaena sp. lw0831]GBO52082.1 nitrate ABC transporter, nitrate-binding protein [Pseudanabaena sp. lw0831]
MPLSRRKLLTTLGVAASTVLLNNCTSKPLPKQPFQINTDVKVSDIPEVQSVRLGIIPSLEVAPILVANNKKLFAKYGMTDVEIVPFRSWQDICDRTVIGTELGKSNDGIDGGHFYSPLPELMNEGLVNQHPRKTAMYVLMRLHTHGGYIVVSKRLKPFGIQLKRATFSPWQDVAKFFGQPMHGAIAEHGSNYDLWLRYWLASMDIIPKQNIDILEIPFDEIIPQVKQNKADLLCLDSWRTLKLIEARLADPAIAIGEIWRNYPGEILAMRADWVDKYPIATQALLQAIMEAQIWCDDPANAKELDTLLALSFTSRNLVSEPIKMFSQLFQNSPKQSMRRLKIDIPNSINSIKYWSNDGISVSYPYKSHDLWFLTEYRRWNPLPIDFETKETIDAVNREDLWKNAAKAIGVPDTNIPISTSRGIETFFDGLKFDPEHPIKTK